MQALFTLVFAGAAFTNGAATWACETIWPNAYGAVSPRVEKVEEQRRTEVYSPRHESAVVVAETMNSFVTAFASQPIYSICGNLPQPSIAELRRDIVVVAEPITNKVLISTTPKYFDDLMKLIADTDDSFIDREKELPNDDEKSERIENVGLGLYS